jgi:hypothetical protein
LEGEREDILCAGARGLTGPARGGWIAVEFFLKKAFDAMR